MAIPYTKDEMTHEFINHLQMMVEYWANVKDPLYDDPKERLSGFLHTVLVTIDGCANGVPPYILIPYGSQEDIDWVLKEESAEKENNLELLEDEYKYYPLPITENDLSGGLHDLLYKK